MFFTTVVLAQAIIPADASAILAQAEKLLNKGQYDLAIESFNQYIRLNPNNALAYKDRGWTYEKLGKHDLAIADCNAALMLDDKFAAAYSTRGWIYECQDKYDLAIADFTAAIKLDPGYTDALYDRAWANEQIGKYNLVITDCDATINLDPHYIAAYNIRGQTYMIQGRHDLAITDFSSAIKMNSIDPYAYLNRSISYRNLGDIVHAQADLSRATALQAYGNEAPPPAQASIMGKKKSCTINFAHGSGIFVMASVDNSHDKYLFMLDTGSPVTIISEKLANLLHVKTVSDQSQASDAGGTQGIFTPCLVNSISLGACRVEYPTCAVSDLQPLESAMGLIGVKEIKISLFSLKTRQLFLGGILGVDFLRHFRVAIDYPRHQMTFSQPTTPLTGKYLFKALNPTSPMSTQLTIPIIADGQTLLVMPDTWSTSTELPYSFLQQLDYPTEDKLLSIGSNSIAAFGYSSDNDLMVRIKDLQIGDCHLRHYLVNQMQSDVGVLGTDMLSQFLVTFDYPHNLLALTPVAHADLRKDNLLSTGIGPISPERHGQRIMGFWQHSPADKAGLQPGDLIIEVNGKKATPAACQQIDANRNEKTPTTVTLLVDSHGKQRTVTLTQADLFPPITQTEAPKDEQSTH
jgi:tetratricopeptide (TPR) repeat protein